MKELEAAFVSALRKFVEEGKLTEAIEANVSMAVNKIIMDLFSYSGPLKKQLQEHIENTLNVDLQGIGLEGYNHTLLQIIKAKVNGSIIQDAKNSIEKTMEDLLATPPKEIKLSDLVEELKNSVTGDGQEPPSEHCTCIFEKSDHGDGGWIYLDKEEGKDKYSCDVIIAIGSEYKVYNLRLNEAEFKDQIIIGCLFGFEKLLFQLYASNATIILDEDAVITAYPYGGDY